MTSADAWLALYRRGATLAEIAAASSVSISTVRRTLHARGVVMRSKGRQAGTSQAPRRMKMAALRARGMTFRAIGLRYGVSVQAVHQALQRQAART